MSSQKRRATHSIRVRPETHTGIQALAYAVGIEVGAVVTGADLVAALVLAGGDDPAAVANGLRRLWAVDRDSA